MMRFFASGKSQGGVHFATGSESPRVLDGDEKDVDDDDDDDYN
jgi:hypothetical protein